MKTVIIILLIAVAGIILSTGAKFIEHITDPPLSPCYEVIIMVPEWDYVEVHMVSDTSGFREMKGVVINIKRIVQ